MDGQSFRFGNTPPTPAAKFISKNQRYHCVLFLYPQSIVVVVHRKEKKLIKLGENRFCIKKFNCQNKEKDYENIRNSKKFSKSG